MKRLILAAALALAACAGHPELQTRVQTQEVRVPVRMPCPNAADVQPEPIRVQVEHPAMPVIPSTGAPDYAAISRILAAKVIELFTYADTAHGQLVACSAP